MNKNQFTDFKIKKKKLDRKSIQFLYRLVNYAATAGATRATGNDSPAARSRGKL